MKLDIDALDALERSAKSYEAHMGCCDRRYMEIRPAAVIDTIERVRTAERQRDEALQQRDAMIAANVAAQAELRSLRAERDALLPIAQAVAGASADQPIGSVKVFSVGACITSRWLLPAAAEALRAAKETT